MVNGLSWPATERLTYRLGETRALARHQPEHAGHPMHMHGFYYDVTASATGCATRRSSPSASAARRDATDAARRHAGDDVDAGARRQLAVPLPRHDARLARAPADRVACQRTAITMRSTTPRQGMAGHGAGRHRASAPEPTRAGDGRVAPRRLTLDDAGRPEARGDSARLRIRADRGRCRACPPRRVSVPGPTLVLRRGEPVEITLVNRLPEATAMHWHGIELDSYYDGVHGWSGAGRRSRRSSSPASTFVVRFTPPRTGTFIYHTHLHDYRQLPSGLYGALLVVEPGETFDPATDHVFVIGRGSRPRHARRASAVLNGERDPQLRLEGGTRHRVRLINITPDDIFR